MDILHMNVLYKEVLGMLLSPLRSGSIITVLLGFKWNNVGFYQYREQDDEAEVSKNKRKLRKMTNMACYRLHYRRKYRYLEQKDRGCFNN